MTSKDGRNIPLEVLNERRRLAVKLRLAGMKVAEVAAQTELSAPTVIAAHKAYQEGGWDAVAAKPRGRNTGEQRSLGAEQETEIRQLICSHLPDQLQLNRSLWQSEAVAELIQQNCAVTLAPRTVALYLKRWGFSQTRPLDLPTEQLPAEARRWLKSQYPLLAERARSEGAEIQWLLESALPGASTATSSKRAQRMGLLGAISNRGKLRWQVYSGSLKADILSGFLDRLNRDTGRRLMLISDGMDLERTPAVKSWLTEHADQLEAFAMPGSGQTSAPVSPPPSSPVAKTSTRTTPRPAAKPAPKVAVEASPEVKHSISQYTTRTAGNGHPKGAHKEMSLTHLQRLEAESIHIIREVVAEADNPVMLYSVGKDSAVMLHLAMKAFAPAIPPFPLLHVDTTWKFREMIQFRDEMVKKLGLDLLVHINPEGLEMGINPFVHGSAIHTDIMKTQGLKQALDKFGFDAAFGGARRDEEKSRAKERIFSFRSAQHRWDPKNQRPELWKLYNARKQKGESIRVFPLSNWTELDIWQYIYLENIPIVPLYFAKERPVVERDGILIMVDDDRMPLREGEVPMMRSVRFRTLGCYPLTGAVESTADTLPAIIQEMLLTTTSERQGRVIDHDSTGSMEKKKQEGYF
ncbi:Sulfate adenylyltransferase subunit 2 [Denitratisoma oestradiolicum]|uniref:Sulfate adenylyltransferase subunit 2 n=2 Tax=Denitratisoma oestradiolicum TaxID=311182 RepID=A0A6S6XUS6_9PROT|nr:sulfate adenylyltransferase small subunit [Denitratisoma oestradiolicum]CAB1369725.1 Sulfate adenylyltransferase subunit 2 [Denitratisoma oestradiolicum]